ncbi:beta-lactamase-like protein [Halteromyces radiatus]|uniref:beta-lactamase-like protein n=1 Tax=Halteromyces radiatus TaxID=101107 RepID=UPI00221EC3F1|nr:beta-lactamase-like protein [Halteromyces radiatus]KAI8096558.1 beta-lactamase-like protein [Halteromyces radiatus]
MVSEFQPIATNNKSYQSTKRGNEYYERQLYLDAISEYSKAIDYAGAATGMEGDEQDNYLALLYSNRCACYLLSHQYALGLSDAEKVIALAPAWAKGYFRVGEAKLKLGQYDQGIQYYRQALEKEPGNPDISHKMGKAVIEKDNQDMGIKIIQIQPGQDIALERQFRNPIQRRIFDFAKHMRNIIYAVVDLDTKQCAVVDACWDIDGLCQLLEKEGYEIVTCIVTHAHFDHVGGSPPAPYDTLPIKISGLATLLKRYPHIKAYIHPHDIPTVRQSNSSIPANRLVPTCTAEITSSLTIGRRTHIQFLHTPGHTPGSQSLLVNDARLIAGDTLLCGGLCGRTDLQGGDRRKLEDTLRNTLGRLDDRIVVYPGHNYGVDWSTIGIEREKGCLGDDLVGFGMHPPSSSSSSSATGKINRTNSRYSYSHHSSIHSSHSDESDRFNDSSRNKSSVDSRI